MRIIAGPCQHESFEQSLTIAKHCKSVCEKYGFKYYFKASYDKANRTSILGKRGLGLEATMHDFRSLKEMLDINILTDVHDVNQINYIKSGWGDYIDVIQIPAFLCRQTDLIRAAVETGKTVNIKKGQFLAPWDVEGILSKTQGAKETWITERGTSFGYNTLVVDFTGINYMLDNFDVPIVFDATHSVQKPGGLGSSSGGNRTYVPGLVRAASALGVKNFFIEVHPDPDSASSDGANMLKLEDFESVVADIVKYSYKETETASIDRHYTGFKT
jgi:2-dehydro-3-deoxyphosphooctonate aldolase (KDO 8-P synthase)